MMQETLTSFLARNLALGARISAGAFTATGMSFTTERPPPTPSAFETPEKCPGWPSGCRRENRPPRTLKIPRGFFHGFPNHPWLRPSKNFSDSAVARRYALAGR